MSFPDDLMYSSEHTWARIDGDIATVGITDYAQDKLEGILSVELHPVDPPAALCAGSQVDLTFASVVAEQALIVPTGALVPHEGGSAVYVLQNGKIRLVPVVVGRRASGYVDIAEGLGEGDRVLTDPYRDGVKAGARARVSG